MTANPNTQSLGGLGVASFVPTDLEVQVSGGNATASANAGGAVIQYTGTATPTTLSLSSQYVDASGISHTETYNLLLIAPTEATGSMNEVLSIIGLPFELNWNVTGTKK